MNAVAKHAASNHALMPAPQPEDGVRYTARLPTHSTRQEAVTSRRSGRIADPALLECLPGSAGAVARTTIPSAAAAPRHRQQCVDALLPSVIPDCMRKLAGRPTGRTYRAGLVLMHEVGTDYPSDRIARTWWFGATSRGLYRVSIVRPPSGNLRITAAIMSKPDFASRNNLRLFDFRLRDRREGQAIIQRLRRQSVVDYETLLEIAAISNKKLDIAMGAVAEADFFSPALSYETWLTELRGIYAYAQSGTLVVNFAD